MPIDTENNTIEKEIVNLQKEIELITTLFNNSRPMKDHRALLRVHNRLVQEKERQEMRLKVHRQKRKDSPIKY